MIPDDEVSGGEDEGEDEYFVQAPEPTILSDQEGQLAIPDLSEFCDKFKADAVHLWNGRLFILCAETRQWVEVGAPPAKKKPQLVQ